MELKEKLVEYLQKKDGDNHEGYEEAHSADAFKAMAKALKDDDHEDGLSALKAIIYECMDEHKSGGGLMIAIGKK